MSANNYFSSVASAIEDLHQRGFLSEFVLLDDQLFCAQMKQFFCGDEFDVLEVYSFEDDRADRGQTVVYAIECVTNAIKGLLFQNSCPKEPYLLARKLRKFWK
jgi:hypothetical protein